MKQGSADDPFADEVTDDSNELTEANATETLNPDTDVDPYEEATGAPSDEALSEQEEAAQRTRRSLPYIHARDGVKDGRTQRPVFLREHIEDGIDELLAEMEAELDEEVYKTDLTEAAMAVAQEHPELVVAKLEEWGYGLR